MIFPTVTEAISPYCDFSKIPPGILQHAADRGTLIHDLCARICTGEFAVPDEECRPYIDSFRQWFELMVAEVLLVETRLTDVKWGYSGQIDLLAKLKDGRISLIDLKSPVALQKSWRVQLAGYNNLCSVAGYKLDCSGSLQLSPQGKMSKMTWYVDGAGDFNYFIQALQLYRFFNS